MSNDRLYYFSEELSISLISVPQNIEIQAY
jgi:hypothetical protein